MRRLPPPALRCRAVVSFLAASVLALGAAAPTWAAGPTAPPAAPATATTDTTHPTGTPRSRPASANAAPFALRLARIDPVVATPGKPVAVRANVTNTSRQTATGIVVDVRLASTPLATRGQVRRRANSTGADAGRLVASATVRGALAPGASVDVDLTIPGDRVPSPQTYGVLPLTLVARDATDRVTVPTFLPYQSIKEYEPLSVAIAVPLTLDADPDLVDGEGADYQAAWDKALGPGSRIDRILTATTDETVTWAIDPALVGLPAQPRGSVDRRAPDTQTSAAAAVVKQQKGLLQRLAQASAGRPVWALPPADPDLSALTAGGITPARLAGLLGRDSGLAQALGVPGINRVAWPVGPALSRADEDAVATAFGGTGPATFITPSTAWESDPDNTGAAPRRTPAGRPLLAYDDELSRLLTATTRRDTGPEVTQRFLAETVTLLRESPGRRRAVLVAAPRTFSPDVPALDGLLSALQATPWLRQVPATDLVAGANEPSTPQAQPATTPADPLSPGPTPLNHATVGQLDEAGAGVAGLESVLAPDADDRLAPRASAVDALTSARWRASPTNFEAALLSVQERLATATAGVTVVPSTINFFAEHGILQVTVVNNLPVEVHDVRLTLSPQGRPSRLRVTAPAAPLRIKPRSRTTVKVGVEAVAAGVVPVSTYLTTPAGTRLGTDATVQMRVQPTNGWLVLALGSLAGIVFLAGLYRALRAGSPRVSSEDLKEIDLR